MMLGEIGLSDTPGCAYVKVMDSLMTEPYLYQTVGDEVEMLIVRLQKKVTPKHLLLQGFVIATFENSFGRSTLT